MKKRFFAAVLGVFTLGIATQCQNLEEKDDQGFGAYKASLSREGDTENADGSAVTGGYIVDDDLVVEGDDNLRSYYLEFVRPLQTGTNPYEQHNLIVGKTNGRDDKWSAAERKKVTYCISDKFASRKTAVIDAMRLAMAAWENAADVHYTYTPGEDGRCDPKNTRVTFDVRPTSGQSYLARSFFPSDTRKDSNVLIDASAFKVKAPLTLTGILRHELGHTLGFRHEHTRPQAGTKCYEDSEWRALTTYDAASVMHYPQCNGTGDWALTLTAKDIAGAQKLYGPPR